MEIVKGQARDIPAVMEIIRRCIERMEEEGIYQWHSSFYPTLQIVEKDVLNRELYLLKGGTDYLACVTLNEEQTTEYKEVGWTCDGRRVLAIHRLMVAPSVQGRGIARKMVAFAQRYASENGYTSIRLDAYSANPRALRLYEGQGYQKAGEIFFPVRPLPFYCYEKEVMPTLPCALEQGGVKDPALGSGRFCQGAVRRSPSEKDR